jgi:catechol 2,3-dioxygenase-like lactoylglutathione lyase family enzyme
MAGAASDARAAGPIRIREIDHVVLRVRDVEHAMAFYRALGCTLERVQERIGLWQLRAGRSLIDLVPVDGELGRAGGAAPGREGRNVDHVCLRVEPWDDAAIRGELARHGVTAEPTKVRFGAEGAGPSIYVTDPDGNTIELRGPADA